MKTSILPNVPRTSELLFSISNRYKHIIPCLLLISASICSNPGGVFAQTNTGYLNPSTNPANGGDVTDPTNVYTSNNADAIFGDNADDPHYGGFGFSIPASAVIVGIEVRLEGSRPDGDADFEVDLSWNNGANWTSIKTVTPDFTTSDEIRTLGSSSDLWGRIWAPSEFSNANFRIRLSPTSNSGQTDLDHIQIRVHYFAQSVTYNANNTFTVPANVTSILVQVIGGGAGGGSGAGADAERGGGGAGAFAQKILTVSPNAMYSVVVGAGGGPGVNGGVSYFNTSSLVDANSVVAAGGTSTTNATGGAGGTLAASNGSPEFAGGSGGDGTNNGAGGGGGGSGFPYATGGNGAVGGGTTGGAGGIGYGNGGAGGDEDGSPAPVAGSPPGGGGGGRGEDAGTSASGATGRVIVAYTCSVSVPPIGGGASSVCVSSNTPAFTNSLPGGAWSIINGTGSATINGSGVATGVTAGTVTVVYSVTDVNGCFGSSTASLTVVSIPSPGSINGSTFGCANTDGHVYSVTNQPGTTYTWSITGGPAFFIESGQGTSQVTVTFGSVFPQTISVTANNSCGSSPASSLTITNTAPAMCTSCTPCSDAPVDPNPDLTAACSGMKVAILIDESFSVVDPVDYTEEVEAGILALVNALNCTGAQVAIAEFAIISNQLTSGYVNVDQNLVDAVEDYFNGVANPLMNNHTYAPSSATAGTNYQAGFMAIQAYSGTPDLFLLVTDGVPTYFIVNPNGSFSSAANASNCPPGGPGNPLNTASVENPARYANLLKCQGTHLFAIGIGLNAIGEQVFEQITGSEEYNGTTNTIANSDYANGGFEDLADDIAAFLTEICPFNTSASGQDICIGGGGNGAITLEIPSEFLAAGFDYVIENASNVVVASGVNIVTSPFVVNDPDLVAGTYTVEITYNPLPGCNRVVSFEVTIEANAVDPGATIDAGDIVHPTCGDPDGGAVTIEITQGESPYTAAIFTGNPPANPPYGTPYDGPDNFVTSTYMFTGLVAGEYFATVTDNNHCDTVVIEFTINAPPACCSATCPADITVACGSSTLPAATGSPTNTSGCGTITYADNVVGGACPVISVITRTWTSSVTGTICTQIITVRDIEAPMINCPANLTLECNASSNYPALINAWIATATASDACDNLVAISTNYNGSSVPALSCNLSSGLNITFTATDDCGNTSTCIRTVYLDDTVPPTASNPAPTNVQCIGAIPVANPEVVINEADNCATPMVALQQESNNSGTGCPGNPRIVTRIYRVTDSCGNTVDVTHTLTVVDNTPPTASNPTPVNVQCIANIPAADPVVVTTEADNCSTPTVALQQQTNNGGTGCPGSPHIVTRIYRVSDACGNTVDVTHTLTALDNQAPVWTTAAGALNASVECSDAAALAAAQAAVPVASDNCDANVTNVVEIAGDFVPSMTCPQEGTYTNTFTVTDDCGNTSAVYTQVITITDNTPPTWNTAAGALNASVECSDAAGLAAAQAAVPVAADNCDANVTNVVEIAGAFVPGMTCPQEGTYTNTFTVTDDCGNISAVYTQVITITDNTATTWTTAAGALNASVECSDAAALAAAQAAVPVAADNCDTGVSNVVEVAGAFVAGSTCAQEGTYTNTFTVTDDCGNVSAVYTQVITVTDNTAPTWVTAAGALNAAVDCSDAGALAAAQAAVPVASDNCDGNVTNIVEVSGAFVPGMTCPLEGTYTNTFTVTDDCGNVSAVYTQIITVTDDAPPTWVTAAGALNATVECSDVAGLAAAQALVPVATDVCDSDVSNVVEVQGAFVPGMTCPQEGTYTNTFTVTDDCGNISAVYTQVITVTDNTPPTWSTAAGALNASVECSDAAGLAAAQAAVPAASDNCDGNVSNVVEVTGAFVPGVTCPQEGTYTNTFTVTDDCGNISAVYTQVITITDNTAPTWTTAAGALNASVECSDAAALAAAQAAVPVAADNCDTGLSNVVEVAGAFVAGSTCAQEGTYTNTFTVTDDCGNVSAVYTQVITVTDNTAPTWTTAAGALNTSVECSNAAALAAAQAAVPVADDNCDGDVTNVVEVPGAFVPGTTCPQEGTYTNTFTVTDDCGNVSAVYTQVITVTDDTPPTWTTAAGALNATVECSDAAALAAAQAAVPVATDACDPDVTNVVEVAGAFVPGPTCPQEGTYTNTFTVTDDCGNVSAVYTQVITVTDNTPPAWNTAAGALNASVACSDAAGLAAAQAAVPVASDNCDGNVTNVVEVAGAFVPSMTCPQEGTYTNTFTVTDDCGNISAVYTQVITIIDNIAPTWTTAAGALNASVECSDAAALATAQAAVPVASDNCDASVANVVEVAGAFVPGLDCAQEGTYTNTFTVTDDCGNVSAVYTQVITVTDNTAPTWTTAADVLHASVECSDAVALAAAQAAVPVGSDNCDGDVTNVVEVPGAFVPGTICPQEGTYTNTFTVTDDCGNVSAVYTQVITVTDDTPPTWTTAADALNVTVECSDAAALAAAQAAVPVATDACDPSVTNVVKVAGAFVPGATCPQEGTYTNTFTVTDDCGNISAVYTQVITVTDNTPPSWLTAAGALNASVECSDATALAAAQSAVPIASDLCDADVSNISETAGVFVPSITCPQEGTYTNTFTVTDDCGNISAVYTQVITVTDNTAPTFTAPANTTINSSAACTYDASISATGDVINEADNCSAGINATFNDEISLNTTCVGTHSINRTWTLTDDCGNSTQHVQTITVVDVTPPVAVAPVDVTLDCFGDIPDAPNTIAAFLGLAGAAANDNCSPEDSLEVSSVTGSLVGTPCNGSITRTYTILDDCGNAATVTQVFVFLDNIDPVVVAGDILPCYPTLEEAEEAVLEATGADDNCTDPLDLIYSVSTSSNGCDSVLTVTVTDACDNTASVSYATIINCQPVQVHVWLEGAYSIAGDSMQNTINDLRALPGQVSPSPLIFDWPAGHTYMGAPHSAFPPANSGTAYGDPPLTPYPASVVDWILVTVREEGIVPANNIWACAGWLHTDGSVTFPEACPMPPININNDYYIVVQHRSHLGIMSPSFANIECDGAYLEWDFRNGDSYRPLPFRVGQKEIEPGVWVMFAGNGDHLASIAAVNSTDHTIWKTLQGLLGYYPSDYNMNVSTNSADESVWKVNQNRTTAVIFY